MSQTSLTPVISKTPQQINPSNTNNLEKFIKALEENKASPQDVARVLADALYATDKKAEADYPSRIKASEMILKALRLLGPEETITMNNIQVNVELEGKTQKELWEIARKIIQH